MKDRVYRSPLPRSVNEYALRLGLQSTAAHNRTRNVPGVLLPHVDRLVSGEVEGVAFLTRVPPQVHQAIGEAIERVLRDWSDGQLVASRENPLPHA